MAVRFTRKVVLLQNNQLTHFCKVGFTYSSVQNCEYLYTAKRKLA